MFLNDFISAVQAHHMQYDELTQQRRTSYRETIMGITISESDLNAGPEEYRPGMQAMPKAKFDKAAHMLLDQLDLMDAMLVEPPPVDLDK